MVVRDGGRIVVAIEAKVGRSPYRGAQRAKDAILRKLNIPTAVVRRVCRYNHGRKGEIQGTR